MQSNAGVSPHAVMVHLENAMITDTAVMGSKGLYILAFIAVEFNILILIYGL
jgi:hypothetical protein